MTTPPNPLQSLPAARERAVKLLGDAFAADAFEMDELESRLARVYRATSIAELDELLRDVAPPVPAVVHAPGSIAAHAAAAPLVVRTLLSSTRRAGRWVVPSRLEVRAVLGDLTLDLRDAELPAGGCEIVVRSLLANVEIIVRPGTPVDLDVSALLASVEDGSRVVTKPDRAAPRVRITGKATFANVEVKSLPSGIEADD